MQEWKSCSVGCKFGFSGDRKPDAAFGLPQPSGTASILRSMESAEYYAENNIAMARRWVSTVVKCYFIRCLHFFACDIIAILATAFTFVH